MPLLLRMVSPESRWLKRHALRPDVPYPANALADPRQRLLMLAIDVDAAGAVVTPMGVAYNQNDREP